jgi:multidrug resistance efflux pump
VEIAFDRSTAIPDEHDEKLAQLRARLAAAQDKIGQAQAEVSQAQIEVRTMQVEAGAMARNYTPPRRQERDEGDLA